MGEGGSGREAASSGSHNDRNWGEGQSMQVGGMESGCDNCGVAHLPAVYDGRKIVGEAITRFVEAVDLSERV